jgi:hypothetical protein
VEVRGEKIQRIFGQKRALIYVLAHGPATIKVREVSNGFHVRLTKP